jgi:hypothetical protein
VPAEALVAPSASGSASSSTSVIDRRRPEPAGSSPVGRILHLCGEGLTLLAVVWSVPLVILCVGLPLAAAIKLVLWIVERF